MNPLRRSSLFLALGLVGFVAIGLTPAQAAPALGTGLVRIDAKWATVKMLPSGQRVLTLGKQASGQWMGELGRSPVPVVRDIDDRDLVAVWDDLGHNPGVGVDSTLTWNSVGSHQMVHLGDPVLTPRGHLRFILEPASETSTFELPIRLENVSVNVHRASSLQPRALPLALPPYVVASDAQVQSTITSNYSTVEVALICDAESVWSSTLNQNNLTQSITPETHCASIIYESGTLKMTVPTISQDGDVLLNATVSVSQGDPYAFSSVVASWGLNQ